MNLSPHGVRPGENEVGLNGGYHSPLLGRPIPEAPRNIPFGSSRHPRRGVERESSAFPASSRGQNYVLPRSGSVAAPAPDRIYVGTGGNALQAVSREALSAVEDNGAGSSSSGGEGLLAVSVPVGIRSGQKIMVSVPDGTGRLIEAIVPPGMREGHTFLVRIPSPDVVLSLPVVPEGLDPDSSPSFASSLSRHPAAVTCLMAPYEGGEIPTAEARVAPPEPQTVVGRDVGPVRMAQVVASGGREDEAREGGRRGQRRVDPPSPVLPRQTSNAMVPESYRQDSSPTPRNIGNSRRSDGSHQDPLDLDWCCGDVDVEDAAHGLPKPTDNYNNNINTSNNDDNSNNDLVLVRVPPGSVPGSTIRVRIDDGRLIEAVVPAANEGEGGNSGLTAAIEFFLRVPPMEGARAGPIHQRQKQQGQQGRQNWHDHPLAIAPMAVGPLL